MGWMRAKSGIQKGLLGERLTASRSKHCCSGVSRL